MRLAADPETARWLEALGGRSEDFEWDSGNRSKNLKHGVKSENVEAILYHPVLFAGRIVEPTYEERRWLVLGIDDAERPLALVFTRRGERVRPISCRKMRRKERALYEEAIARNTSPPKG
jgi:uncharacterized DUF497 family protein